MSYICPFCKSNCHGNYVDHISFCSDLKVHGICKGGTNPGHRWIGTAKFKHL